MASVKLARFTKFVVTICERLPILPTVVSVLRATTARLAQALLLAFIHHTKATNDIEVEASFSGSTRSSR